MSNTPQLISVEGDITESNRLIAQFMGLKNISGSSISFDDSKCWYDEKDCLVFNGDLRYHVSWDLLMPVWVKVLSILKPQIKNDPWLNHHKAISYAILNYDIKIAFDRIVRFIEWYNQQPQP